MRYLIEDKVDELLDTVRILSISDDEVGDISQYFFDSGEADEYASGPYPFPEYLKMPVQL